MQVNRGAARLNHLNWPLQDLTHAQLESRDAHLPVHVCTLNGMQCVTVTITVKP